MHLIEQNVSVGGGNVIRIIIIIMKMYSSKSDELKILPKIFMWIFSCFYINIFITLSYRLYQKIYVRTSSRFFFVGQLSNR